MKSILDHHESVTSEVEETEIEHAEGHALMIHYASLTDYERLFKPADLARAVFTMDNESVLIRRPFKWSKDGEPLADAHASMELEQVCELYDWKIVATFGHHFAIVAPANAST